jgi:hypothetical protein
MVAWQRYPEVPSISGLQTARRRSRKAWITLHAVFAKISHGPFRFQPSTHRPAMISIRNRHNHKPRPTPAHSLFQPLFRPHAEPCHVCHACFCPCDLSPQLVPVLPTHQPIHPQTVPHSLVLQRRPLDPCLGPPCKCLFFVFHGRVRVLTPASPLLPLSPIARPLAPTELPSTVFVLLPSLSLLSNRLAVPTWPMHPQPGRAVLCPPCHWPKFPNPDVMLTGCPNSRSALDSLRPWSHAGLALGNADSVLAVVVPS